MQNYYSAHYTYCLVTFSLALIVVVIQVHEKNGVRITKKIFTRSRASARIGFRQARNNIECRTAERNLDSTKLHQITHGQTLSNNVATVGLPCLVKKTDFYESKASPDTVFKILRVSKLKRQHGIR